MPDVRNPAGTPDEDDEAEDGSGIDGGDFVVAGTADDRLEADLLVRACEDAGIPAVVRAPRDSMVGKIDAPTEVLEILVNNDDLERARPLLAARKAELESDPAAAERAAVEEEAAGEAAAGKPTT